MLKIYKVYIDATTYNNSSEDIYSVLIPAENVEKAIEYANGNGEIIATKDVTDNFNVNISDVMQAMENEGLSKEIITIVERTLEMLENHSF